MSDHSTSHAAPIFLCLPPLTPQKNELRQGTSPQLCAQQPLSSLRVGGSVLFTAYSLHT